MAATLLAQCSASVSWTYQTALSGSITPTVTSSFTYSGNTTNGTGAAGTADLMYAIQGTLAGGANTTIDMAGSVTDFFGTTVTMARVKTIFFLLSTATTATSVNIFGGSNPLLFLNTGATTCTVYNGGCLMLSGTGATQYAVTASTGDLFKILNNDGSNTATYQVVFIGSSA